LLTLAFIVALAVTAQASDQLKYDPIDGAPVIPNRVQIQGTLTLQDPTWHRWRGVDYNQVSLDCNLAMTYEYTSDPHYQVFCIESTNTSPIQIWTAPVTGQFDTVLYLYCDPFDPLNSTENCVTVDDDGGDGLLSYIGLTTNVTLTPGVDYWLVICGYGATTVGQYTIQTSENVILCTTPVDEATWSAIKSLY
jgi:hypothetical protein